MKHVAVLHACFYNEAFLPVDNPVLEWTAFWINAYGSGVLMGTLSYPGEWLG